MRVNQIYEQRPDCDLVCFAEAVTRDPFLLIGRDPTPDFTPGRSAARRGSRRSARCRPRGCACRRICAAPGSIPSARPGRRPHDGRNMAALRGGELDVVQLFQPFAEELIASGDGHLWYAAATAGPCSYTSFYARRGTARAKTRRDAERWCARYTAPRNGCTLQPPEALADVVAALFPDVAPPLLRAALARYHALGIWGRDPILPRAGYERLEAGLVSGGFVRRHAVREGGRQQPRRAGRRRRPAAAD